MVDPDLRRQVLAHMSWDEQASHASSTTVSHRPYRPKPRKTVTFAVPEAIVIPSSIELEAPDDTAQEATDSDAPIASIKRSLSPLVGTSTERHELEEENEIEEDHVPRPVFIRECHPSLSPTILAQRSRKRCRSTSEIEPEEEQIASELGEQRRDNPAPSSKIRRNIFLNTPSPLVSPSESWRSYQATPELEQTPSPTFCPGFHYSRKNGESSGSSSSRVKRQRKKRQCESERDSEQVSAQDLHERRVPQTPLSPKGTEPCRLNSEHELEVEQSPSLVFSPSSTDFGNGYQKPVYLSPSPQSEGKSSLPEYEVRSPPRLSSPVRQTFGKRYQRSLDLPTSLQSKGKGRELNSEPEQEGILPPRQGQAKPVDQSPTPRSKGKGRRLDSESEEEQNPPPVAFGYGDLRHAIDRSRSSQTKKQNLELNSASVGGQSSHAPPFVAPGHFSKRSRDSSDLSRFAQPEGKKRRKLAASSGREQSPAAAASQHFGERGQDLSDHSPHATLAHQQVSIQIPQYQSLRNPKPTNPRRKPKRHRSPLIPNYQRPLSSATKPGTNKKWTINKAPFFSPMNFEADSVAMGMGGRGTRAKDRKEKMSRVREYWAVPESSGIKVYGRVAVTESRAWVEGG